MTLSQLRELLNLLNTTFAKLEQVCEKNGTSIPDLTEPFHPSSEIFRKDPAAAEAASIIGAAAMHISDIINPPEVSLFTIIGGPTRAAALRVCVESSVAEMLRDAGPRDMHVNDIAAQNGQDPAKLSDCLRYLATYHVFQEITPDVFGNTRISSVLDTGKSIQEILAHPDKKYEDTSGFTALVAFQLDECTKTCAYIWEVLSNPAITKSNEPSESALTQYVGRGKTLWEFYADPDQDYRSRRFNIGMHGIQTLQPPDILLSAYEWGKVPPCAVIVDVGGGVGTTQLCLAREFSHFKIVIQDRLNVVTGGIKMWHDKDPEALRSGRVVFEAHDFFEPQPERDVSFFFLKQILHDWPDNYCFKILTHLRKAASPNTKLLSMDTVMPYACRDTSNLYSFPGATPDEVPPPLLANWGVNTHLHCSNITMLAFFNSRERTLGASVSLFKRSGWKVVEIHRQKGAQGSYLQCLEAIPI